MIRLLLFLFYLALAIALTNCAGLFKKTPTKAHLLSTREQKDPPQSVKAVWTITLYSSSKSKNTFKGVLLANPYTRYIITWIGPLNISLGSFRWQNNKWKVEVPGVHQEGTGEYVPILGKSHQGISIHSLMEFMWNGYLQKNLYLIPDSKKPNLFKSSAGEKLYIIDKNIYVQVKKNQVDSTSINLVQSLHKRNLGQVYSLKFKDYKNIRGYNIPQYVEIYSAKTLQATIKVSKVKIKQSED